MNPEGHIWSPSQDVLDATAFSGLNIQLGQVFILNMGHLRSVAMQTPSLETTETKPHTMGDGELLAWHSLWQNVRDHEIE